MGMIAPSIGRVVWYMPPADQRIAGQPDDQFLAAHVTYVWGDRMVNLMAITPNGAPFGVTSVTLVQDGDATPQDRYATWMPYQKGQAAKAEAAQSASPEQARVGRSLGKLVHAISDILRVSYPHLDPLHDEMTKHAEELVHAEKPPATTGL